jgi:replicative DNA helicase
MAADLLFKRGLPVALDAERLILGMLLLDGGRWREVAGALSVEDFSLEVNRRIFSSMEALVQRGQRIDRVTVADELMKQGRLESIGGLTYLVSLDEGIPEIPNMDSYVRMTQDAAILRRAIVGCESLMQECLSRANDTPAILARLARLAKDLEGQLADTSAMETPDQIVQVAGACSIFADGHKVWLPTPWPRLNQLIGGFEPGQMVVVGGRPGSGKSVFMGQCAWDAALSGKQTVIVSLEMSQVSIIQRFISTRGGIALHRVRSGQMDQDQRGVAQMALYEAVETGTLRIADKLYTVPAIRAALARLAAKQKIEFIVIDYLQLLTTGNGRHSLVEEVTQISRAIKLLAVEFECPVLIGSQLSRESEKENREPRLSDLRNSGCLHGESLVTLADSGKRVPIRSLVGQSRFNVWSRIGDKTEACECSRVFSNGIKPMFEITTVSGRKIKATGNHRFMSPGGWRQLEEFAAGDSIACYAQIPESKSDIDLSDNELFFMGHMVGNGCVLPRHSAQYTTPHKDLGNAVKDSAIALFGDEVNPRVEYANPRNQGGWYQVFMSSTRRHTHGVRSVVSEWAEAFGLFGKRAHQKEVPAAIYQHSNRGIARFLSGLWETDGTMTSSQIGLAYSTSSPALAEGVGYLLSRLGVLSSIGPPHRGNYQVSIVGGREAYDMALRLFSFVGDYANGRKNAILQKIDSLVGHSTTTKLSDKGLSWEKIRTISSIGNHEAFDMTVPNAENMEVLSFVAHNSLEQDADTVIFPHPLKIQDDPETQTPRVEFIVAKQRNGRCGRVPMVFEKPYVRFSEA